MWVLYFLLAVPLCECAAVGKELFSEERNDAEYLTYGSGTENIQAKMEKIASDLLNDLIDAQTSRGNRQKREMRDIKPSSLSDKTGVFRLQRIKPFLNVCSRPTDIAFVDVGNSTYSICISTPADDAPTANVVQLTTRGSKILDSWFTNNPSKAVSFSYGQKVYVLIADSGRGDGTDLIRFDVSTLSSYVDHTVHSKHATAIALWEMKTDGTYHLAIANSDGNKDSYDLSTEIFTYIWMGTYFDKYSSFAAYDVRDIEPFHIHNMAYLAVANHRRGKGNYHVDSEILKYNLDLGKWISFQKIRTYGAMDWESFTLGSGTGKEFFLAVANYVEQGNHDINSVIYKFVKDKFVPFQCLQTRGATSIAALSDENWFLLAIANEYEAVYLYQYNGWRFVPASVQFTQSTMSSGVTSVSFHTIMDYKDKKLVLAVSNPTKEGPSLYEMELVKENALDTWHNDSTEWCLRVLDEIEDSESNKLLIDMNNVIYTDKDQQIVIEGNLNFQDGLEASLITGPKVIDIKEKVAYDGSILLKLKDLNVRLQRIEQRLKKAEEHLRKAVSINGDQILFGNYSFKDVTFNCEDYSCHFEKIETLHLNGEDVTNLKNKVIFTDEEVFVHSLNIENAKVNNLAINGLLDGVDLSKIVTKSGSHYITGTKVFADIISKEIEVAGFVDGEKVTSSTVLLDGGFQNATGNLIFADIETSSLEVTGIVNDVDLNFFYRNLVMSDKSYTIEGLKTFSDLTVRHLNVKLINGVDISELWNNVMWRNEAQIITAPMSFSSLVAENNVLVSGYINGFKIPGPDVFLVNSSGVIRAHKLFKKTSKISELSVTGSINGIRVLDNISGGKGQLDILLKDGNQVITGHKAFREIILDDHSYVLGRVNEVDLSGLQDSAWRKNTSTGSVDSWLFNNLIVKGPLTVHGLVADSDLSAIYDNAVKLEDPQMPNFESVTFQDGLNVDDFRSDTVNYLDLTKQLVLKEDQESVKGHQAVKGFKTFQDMNVEADSDVSGLVNNINISFLHKSILRLGKQVITTPLTSEGNLRIRSLTIKGLLNVKSVAELVTLTGKEAITGNKIFSNMEAGNLYVGNLQVGLINDIDIEAEVENTMTYDGEQSVSGLKSVTGKITLSKNSNLNTDSLNDVDISSVWEDSVLVDVPQNITGNKVFMDDVTFNNFKFHESLDGVTEWDLQYNWMTQDLEQEVLGDVIVAESAELSDITFSGLVNEVAIAELNSQIVKRTESAVIDGPVIFEDIVISYGDISLTGSVKNIDLSEEAVLKSKHNIIVGEKEFLSDITVPGDISVSGLVDKVSIKDICENSVKQNIKLGDTTVTGDVVFEGGVKIGGVLAGVDIDQLYGLKTEAEEPFINGLKTFENLTIRGPITLYGNIGSEDIKLLKDTYMSLSRDQEISSSLHFDEMKVQGTPSSSNFYTHDNKVNNIDLVRLQSGLLKTSGMQSANATYRFDLLTFADDVVVVGRVNGIEIPKGLMRKNRVNYVYNSKVFKQNVTVLGDLMMEDGKTVHGIDLSEWERQSVLKDGGKKVIDGLKVFNKATMNDVRIHGTINGIKIFEDNLLMTYGDQSVKGRKEIFGPVNLFRDLTVHGLINGVDLNDFARRAAKRHMKNTFSGMKYFSQPVTIGTLETGLINGVDFRELNKTIHTKLNFDVLSNRMTELKEAVSEMKSAFENQAILLRYYELFQGFKIPGSYLWHYVAAPDTKELLLLSDFSIPGKDCTGIRIFEFNPEKELFEPKQQIIEASYAVAMRTIFIWDSTYLFVANSMPSSSCSSVEAKYSLVSGNRTTWGQILVWNEDNSMFSEHQIIAMEPATDVVVFGDHKTLCSVYTEMQDTKLYCADENRKDFAWRETLQTRNGRKMSLIEDSSDWPLIRLAVAGTDLGDNVNYVDIYNWKGEAGVFGPPVQRIKTSNANSVAFMMHPNMYEIFLVISEGVISGVGNMPRLLVHKLEEKVNLFVKYQEIKDSGYLEWIILPSGDLILFVLDTTGNIKIYRHRYSSSFVLEDTLYYTGAKTLHAFERMVPEDTNHYLALAGPQRTLPHGPEGMDLAKILKSNIKGKRLLY